MTNGGRERFSSPFRRFWPLRSALAPDPLEDECGKDDGHYPKPNRCRGIHTLHLPPGRGRLPAARAIPPNPGTPRILPAFRLSSMPGQTRFSASQRDGSP